jgi:hypothetical protein
MRTVPGWRDLRGVHDRTALRTYNLHLLATDAEGCCFEAAMKCVLVANRCVVVGC